MKRVLLVLVGCRIHEHSNTAACEDYVATFECGGVDASYVIGIECADYEERVCDFYEYFDCLSDGYTCDEASGALTPDPEKLATCPEGPDCR